MKYTDREIKVKLNSKRNYREYTNLWKLNNTVSSDEWVTEEIRRSLKKSRKFLETNENDDKTYQNLKNCDA